MSAPPDLRVLCKRLTSTPPDELARLCPVLVSHVLRCGGPLSAAQDAKGKDKLAETPVLIHKLKTSITTLLMGRNASGRFTAVCLIKAVIDVGGWECLKSAGPWITGLISVLQKPEPFASKKLCVVTLTRIYTLLHGYQTLIREMATPTLPNYVNACIQLIKTPASGKPLMTPSSLIETVICSLSKLVTIYPTTLRPSTTAIKAAIKLYVAPTSTDSVVVPESLRQASRRLSALLPYTVAKNGSSDEWAKAVTTLIKDCHATADQVLRAVHESWESSTGYRAEAVSTEADPSGGGDSADDLPVWTGVPAGGERLAGQMDTLAEYLRAPTKASVTLPIGELLDLTSRLTLITLPSGSDETVNMNAAIGKDEKSELWSALPDIHTAVMRLHTVIVSRLKDSALPLSTDLIDQMVRVFNSNRHVSSVRETTYTLAKEMLSLSGPTLPKLTVDTLSLIIQGCCQDILRAAGHLEEKSPEPTPATTNGKKQSQQTPSSTNADDYLTMSANGTGSSFFLLSPSHKAAAADLLPLFISHLPRKHLSPDSRGLVDRTAILSNNKPAMLASCLYPYKDSRGRFYPSILPYLIRQFPRDQDVEVLRTNLLKGGRYALTAAQEDWDPREGLEELIKEPVQDEDEDDGSVLVSMEDDTSAAVSTDTKTKTKPSSGWEDMEIDSATPAAPSTNAFFVSSTTTTTTTTTQQEATPKKSTATTPLKRKAESVATRKSKRLSIAAGEPQAVQHEDVQIALMPKIAEPKVEVAVAVAKVVEEKAVVDDSDDDSDEEGSVQIDMTMEDDDEDEEEDEE